MMDIDWAIITNMSRTQLKMFAAYHGVVVKWYHTKGKIRKLCIESNKKRCGVFAKIKMLKFQLFLLNYTKPR